LATAAGVPVKDATARIEFGMTAQNGQSVYFVRDDGAGFDMASLRATLARERGGPVFIHGHPDVIAGRAVVRRFQQHRRGAWRAGH